MSGRNLLGAGAAGSFLVALLHIAIALAGANAYRYFGAGEEMARMAEAGSPFPAVLTLMLAGVFAMFGFYGLAAAGIAPPLPLANKLALGIGVIYSVRGLMLFPALFAVGSSPDAIKAAIFSAVSLTIGLCYVIGRARLQRGR